MRGWRAFWRKEYTHHLRSYRLLILLVVFSLFGIMSPLAARLMPDLLAALMPEGMQITLPPPTALDAWGQYQKNMSQIGLITLALVFSTTMAHELASGRLILLLTKGLRRPAVITAKWAFMLSAWTLCVLWSFALCYGYTAFLFPGEHMPGLLSAAGGMWLFGLMMLSVLLLCAVLFRGSTGCLLGTGALMGLIALSGFVPAISRANPWQLIAQGAGLPGGGLLAPALFALGLVALCLGCAVAAFNRKALA